MVRARKDIQLLRGIAVLLVIFNHTKLGFFHGELGVDIFFVISGYLITDILLKKKNSIEEFYSRRVKRILPVSSVVIFSTLVIATLVKVGSLKDNFYDGFYGSIFAMNWRLIYLNSDYYSMNGNTSLFQHLWSLAVEEQFYIIWPLITLFLLKGVKKSVGLFSILVTSLSLIYYFSLINNFTGTNYFNTFGRVWEISLGAISLVYGDRISKKISAVFLLLIVVLLTSFNMLEINITRVIVAFLTALILAIGFNVDKKYFTGLLFIGDISYSLYMVHWPTYEIISRSSHHLESGLLSIALAFWISYIIYILIESPVRMSRVANKVIVSLGILVTLTSSLTYLTLAETRVGIEQANIKNNYPKDIESLRREIAKSSEDGYSPKKITPSLEGAHDDLQLWNMYGRCPELVSWCNINDIDANKIRKKIIFIGDSHVTMWVTAFKEYAIKNNYEILLYSKGGCPPTLSKVEDFNGIYTEDRVNLCNQYVKDVTSDLKSSGGDTLIITSSLSTSNYTYNLGDRISELKKYFKRVLVIGDFHYGIENIKLCLQQNFNKPSVCGSRYSFDKVKEFRSQERDETVKAGGEYYDIRDLQCYKEFCPPVINGILIYRDNYHFTQTYTTYLSNILMSRLKI